MAFAYRDILNYRKLSTPEEKKAKYTKLHFWISRPWVSYIIQYISVGMIFYCLTNNN